MDHEALKSLLNTPHPSGKLAHWGLATQELRISTDPVTSWEEEPECRCSFLFAYIKIGSEEGRGSCSNRQRRSGQCFGM